MRKRRDKKAVINDKLIELFRNALAAQKALRKRPLPVAEVQRLANIKYAFHKAVGHVPWEPDPLDPHADGEAGALRAALLSEIKRQDRAAKT
jgi:hypothetical protein